MEQNVTLIISVCKLEEGGRVKCHQYWPTSEHDKDTAFAKLITTPGLKINQVSSRSLGTTLEERIFEVTKGSGAKHTVR